MTIHQPLSALGSADALRPLLRYSNALDHPVTLWTTSGAIGAVIGAMVVVALLRRTGRIDPALAADISTRTRTWAILAPAVIVPILAGGLWTILLIGALSLLSYREFARATGLFRDRLTSALVALGILAITFANVDHWRGLVAGVTAITLGLICVANVFLDQPKGYIQRCALGCAAFMLFGVGLGRAGMLANDPEYRPLLLALIVCIQLNDVFAYCCGKAFGRALGVKLFPNTSPGKTLAGHIGALVLTTPLTAFLFAQVFVGRPLSLLGHAVALGLMVSVFGQLGDLVVSSVKRDLGIKDMGAVLPGHGGVLDRCNSLLLAFPAVYHYILLVQNFAAEQPVRVLTGGG